MTKSSLLAFALGTVLSAGCIAEDKGLEDNTDFDGKADSFYAPTQHGDFGFVAPSKTAFTAARRKSIASRTSAA